MHSSCPSGHPLTRANTYKHNFKRQCRACRRSRERTRQANIRALVKAQEAIWLADLPAILDLDTHLNGPYEGSDSA